MEKAIGKNQEPIPETSDLVEVEKQVDETGIYRKAKDDSLATIVGQRNMIR